MKNGDTFTGSIPVMLETVSNKMRQIYNFHAGANPQVMLDQFLQKYQGPIQAANCQADVPALKPEHFFKACQKKADSKASGLDQWRYKDLQQLPVQGWVPFYLIAMLAEATGEWPRAMTCISVSCIPKDDSPVLNPDAIRAIGVSSDVYGLWSSIRFGHLGDWMNSVAPATLLGGLPGRSAELSEIEFSHAVQEPNEAERVVAIFIDRFKCFDMVLPHVGLGVAKAVGLPGAIFKGISGFYANQVKLFKIGSFYGKEVLSCNAVIQGCSMSVMMVNVLYSILVRSLQQVAPSVSITTFIDDCKFWCAQNSTGDLINAFEHLVDFDNSIGQILNEKKSEILAPRKSLAKKIKGLIRRPFLISSQVKSLGRIHQGSLKKNASKQDARVKKAIPILKKISCLPIPLEHKAMFVQCHVHSKWVFGTETQGISVRALKTLRAATADVLDPSGHKIRSPALMLATQKDPFLDPLGKWVWHVVNGVRKIAKKDPTAARQILKKAALIPSPRSGAINGHHRIFRFLLDRIGWTIGDPNKLEIESPGGTFLLTDFSNGFFNGVLGDAVRMRLVSSLPSRYETGTVPLQSEIDIYLTRILCDASFLHDKHFEPVIPFLERL